MIVAKAVWAVVLLVLTCNSLAMFPDGLSHDFGKVTRGTFCKHSFRIVNTIEVPLKILSLRVAA